jgi:hypothetical protein
MSKNHFTEFSKIVFFTQIEKILILQATFFDQIEST